MIYQIEINLTKEELAKILCNREFRFKPIANYWRIGPEILCGCGDVKELFEEWWKSAVIEQLGSPPSGYLELQQWLRRKDDLCEKLGMKEFVRWLFQNKGFVRGEIPVFKGF